MFYGITGCDTFASLFVNVKGGLKHLQKSTFNQYLVGDAHLALNEDDKMKRKQASDFILSHKPKTFQLQQNFKSNQLISNTQSFAHLPLSNEASHQNDTSPAHC